MGKRNEEELKKLISIHSISLAILVSFSGYTFLRDIKSILKLGFYFVSYPL